MSSNWIDQELVAKSLHEYFYNLDTPPVDELLVNPKKIHQDQYDRNVVNAELIYISNSPSKRTHSVNIQIDRWSMSATMQNLKYIYV